MKPIFVVHKHAARNLHYDFRLQMKHGEIYILKSWAIPKGPSLDFKVKRLAVLVDDHDMSYKNFEGKIPEGEYGAGDVIVWDTGFYQPLKNNTLLSLDEFQQSFEKGNMEFELFGYKLKGKFALIKIKNNWLLLKMKDEHVSDSDVLKRDKSVISQRTINL